MPNLNVKWLVTLSHHINGGKHSTFGKHPTTWPFAAEWHCLSVQYGGILFCALITLPCWEGRTLLRSPLWGIEGVVSNLECSTREQRWGASQAWRTFSKKKLTEHLGRTVTPIQETGGPRHPQGGLGIFEGGSVWFDSAHWVSKLCDNFLVPGAWTFILIPLCQCWTPQVRSVSLCYCHTPTPGQRGRIVIFMLPVFIQWF